MLVVECRALTRHLISVALQWHWYGHEGYVADELGVGVEDHVDGPRQAVILTVNSEEENVAGQIRGYEQVFLSVGKQPDQAEVTATALKPWLQLVVLWL